jgi:polyvinyl alcohol dehydrogenase (cytochrome)
VRTSSTASLPYDGIVMGLNGKGTQVKWELTRPASPLFGSLATANGVLYFQSPLEENPASAGNPPTWALYALHTGTGEVLKRIEVPNSRSLNGPAISNGRVYAAFGQAFSFGLAGVVPEGGVVCFGLPND